MAAELEQQGTAVRLMVRCGVDVKDAGEDVTLTEIGGMAEQEAEMNAADILQQALQEATAGMEQVPVAYDSVESAVAVIHGELQEADDGKATIPVVTISDGEVVEEEPPASNNVTTVEPASNVGAPHEDAVSESTEDTPAVAKPIESCELQDDAGITITPASGTGFSHLTLSPKSTTAPLGSSENPIQIIQQGSTYHSTQVLTREQLQQIAHVLQQQQVTRAIRNGGSAVLYNPATNTRIVYRVIYPSELRGTSVGRASGKGRGLVSAGRGRGRPKKTWTKKVEDDDNRPDGPNMSKEEKEEKKRHRPRTRSGRISKPPSYMVKDYKRIHHLDFNDDPYDDSDGGYSDYRVSDEESPYHQKPTSLPPGVTTAKPRNYKCPICEKAYIGRGGLARHFRLNPTHGSLPDVDVASTQDENSNSSMISVPSSTGSQVSSQPANASAPARDQFNTAQSKRLDTQQPKPAQKSFAQDPASLRRKAKLKELLQHCRDEEVMEVVLPRLVQGITLWEFLLMKSENGYPAQLHVPDIFRHFESILKHLQKLAEQCLRPLAVDQDGSNNGNKTRLEISNEHVAQLLSIPAGTYEVKSELFMEDKLFRYKRQATKPVEAHQGQNGRRMVQVVSPEEIVESPPKKRLCLGNSGADKLQTLTNVNFSDQILNGTIDRLDFSRHQANGLDEMEENTSQRGPQQMLNEVLTDSDSQCALDTSGSLFTIENSANSVGVQRQGLVARPGSLSAENQDSIGNRVEILRMDGSETASQLQVRKVQLFQSLDGVIPHSTPLVIPVTCSSSSADSVSSSRPELQDSNGELIVSTANVIRNLATSDSTSSGSSFRIQGISTGISGQTTCSVVASNFGIQSIGSRDSGALTLQDIAGCGDIAGQAIGTCAVVNSLSDETVRELVASGIILHDVTSQAEGQNVIVTVPDISSGENTSMDTLAVSSHKLNNSSHLSQELPLVVENGTDLLQQGVHLTTKDQLVDVMEPANDVATDQLVTEDNSHSAIEESHIAEFGEVVCDGGVVLSENSTESTAVIRQLVLPDGQIIGTWAAASQLEGLSELEEQLTQGFLPNNVVIVQNPDGTTTLQMPRDQAIPLETVQALLAMDDGIVSTLGQTTEEVQQIEMAEGH